MRFGKTLRESVYAPWKEKYIDYTKLKTILREDRPEDDETWTEDDENRFCDEIFNVQLEKVTQFQQEQVDTLKARTEAAFEKLKELSPAPPADDSPPSGIKNDANVGKLKQLEAELDKITTEVKELKKYSSVNYTGFLKIVKKHDRKRGEHYRVRPMMQHNLSQRPFNSEQGYSPLLNKLSIMYYAIRQQLDGPENAPTVPDLESPAEILNGERYTAHKFWVHPDNLLEVKTHILRHLPALVYSDMSSKEMDVGDAPAVTSLYFDNKSFELYSKKVERQSAAASLRLRWYGQLSTKPDVFIEQKQADAGGESQESKFTVKEKYIQSFLDGTFSTDKAVSKMERQAQSEARIESYKKTVASIQDFQQQKKLQPMLRANYVRTAFQNPSDDRLRISIDTNLAFIREDALDQSRPCRDPKDWHRADIDDGNMSYPFKNINQSEVSKFPYAVLEIKIKEDGTGKRSTWIEDLMISHLVHPAPRFSKFVHGVASLFEDFVNNLPFWLSDLETDIRKDPQAAFEQEEQRRAQLADDVLAVGSLIGTVPSSFKAPAQSSPISKSYLSDRMMAESSAQLARSANNRSSLAAAADEAGESSQQNGNGHSTGYGALSSVLPGLSLSKYARAKRAQKTILPDGVVEPTEWIKNTGELKIEPKVWLANERTFLKWQHICVLQGGLALGLYTAAGDNNIVRFMGLAYIIIAVFAGVWGYSMLQTRRSMIMGRSGKDFDNVIGPIIISVALMAALITNFILQYRAAFDKINNRTPSELESDFSQELR